jgi:hypothetical protein
MNAHFTNNGMRSTWKPTEELDILPSVGDELHIELEAPVDHDVSVRHIKVWRRVIDYDEKFIDIHFHFMDEQ